MVAHPWWIGELPKRLVGWRRAPRTTRLVVVKGRVIYLLFKRGSHLHRGKHFQMGKVSGHSIEGVEQKERVSMGKGT